MKEKYRLYDNFCLEFGRELLGRFKNMNEVKKACKKRDVDVDGEWVPLLFKLGKDDRYHKIDDWHY